MGYFTTQIGQIAAVTLQLRIITIESIQGFFGNRHDLRRVKAAGGAQLHHHTHKLPLQRLGMGISGILIRFAHTVIAQSVSLDIELLGSVKILI